MAKAFTQIPNGIPGIEDRVNLMYTYGVKRADSIFTASLRCETRPARLFGLFPRKGTIAAGWTRDLIVYDTIYRGTVSAATQHGNNDYNGFEGFAIDGRLSPGVTAARQSAGPRRSFCGRAGGRLLRREPQYGALGAAMPVDAQATIDPLKELRALTADENGARSDWPGARSGSRPAAGSSPNSASCPSSITLTRPATVGPRLPEALGRP